MKGRIVIGIPNSPHRHVVCPESIFACPAILAEPLVNSTMTKGNYNCAYIYLAIRLQVKLCNKDFSASPCSVFMPWVTGKVTGLEPYNAWYFYFLHKYSSSLRRAKHRMEWPKYCIVLKNLYLTAKSPFQLELGRIDWSIAVFWRISILLQNPISIRMEVGMKYILLYKYLTV